ncbi:universal stress protein [Mycolicibacter hiberniae]|uniref:Universal stress protein n=1 Tax=Mycolicibacter hiberniae TaxID=29314 RepID=A0A7I7X3A4_9MYCO|nr:universal stress protein [Mycolicibacter hiberniae]MCV7084837.1 universal stress protein [Mycolicibacter hiberniae]BBZ23323.1 universal stress protein [Mycolicibacter hiberniae]
MSESMSSQSVVVGIDGSQAAAHAATWAAREASARGLPLRLVHVIAEEAAEAAPTQPDLGVEYAETVLREVDLLLRENASELKVETAMPHGPPGSALIDESRDSAMVCVGSVGIGCLSRAIFGSTAAELAQGAHCPVAVIRAHGGTGAARGWIAVAVDHTPGDDLLLEHAFREAQLRDAPILAIESQPWRRVGRHTLRIEYWASRYPGVRIRLTPLRRGLPDALGQIGEPVQLAVIGKHDADDVPRIVGPPDVGVSEPAGSSVLVVRD